MYIRPLLFGSSAQLGLSPPEEYLFVVYVMPTGVYHGVHAVDALILEDFDRSAPEGTGHAKIGRSSSRYKLSKWLTSFRWKLRTCPDVILVFHTHILLGSRPPP